MQFKGKLINQTCENDKKTNFGSGYSEALFLPFLLSLAILSQ